MADYSNMEGSYLYLRLFKCGGASVIEKINRLVFPNNVTKDLGYTWDSSWILQYESPWNILLKFCYMNSITFNDLFKLYGKENLKDKKGVMHDCNKSVKSLFGLIENLLSEVLKYPIHQKNEKLLNMILLSFSPNEQLNYKFIDSDLKLCPICFKNNFHSTLHQFSFIQTCPFHKIKLITQCPKCNMKYFYNLIDSPLENNYSCKCGFAFASENRSVKYNFFPNIIDPAVKKWITLTSTEIAKIQKFLIIDEYALALDNEKVLFSYNIPFVLNCLDITTSTIQGGNYDYLDRRLVRERVTQVSYLNKRIKCKDFFENRNITNTYQQFFESKNLEYPYKQFFEREDLVYSYQQTQNVCDSIARHFRKTILKKHIGCIKELTRYRETLEDEEICPFAIAYVYWRLRIQGFKKYEYVDNWGTTPIFKERDLDFGYPVYTYKFYDWLQELQRGLVIPEDMSFSRNTYLWLVIHLIKEMIIAEFYRCFEYGLNFRDNNKNYTISSIYSLKYIPKFLIQREGNKYFCFREDKREFHELNKVIENTTCVNSTAKNGRKRKKFRSKYIRTNPILDALARRN